MDMEFLGTLQGRVTIQAVNRQLVTAETRVRS
jgi:hypothetical protein